MTFLTLQEFLCALNEKKDLHQIDQPIDPVLEITEVSRRFLERDGPALQFNHPSSGNMPVITNLFASQRRIAAGLGLEDVSQLRDFGELLASLKDPQPPKNLREIWGKVPLFRRALAMAPRQIKKTECYATSVKGDEVDLTTLPVQTCWPDDAGPLITWGLVITRNCETGRHNVGVYRLQVLGKNRVIMRWLAHRGGALDYQRWLKKNPEQPFPVAVVMGADPATILAAVMPVPDTLSELGFAGLLRGKRSEVVVGQSVDLQIPASAEIVLEGFITPGEYADEGPFADHTGYYNEVDSFPVMKIEQLSHRDNPVYLSTYTGRPPDEPAVLGQALNELFVPIIQRQFPEIVDFYLPSEACSYRMAVVSIRKQYPGHARKIMMGIWSFLQQFMYTKMVIVTDNDIDIRNWPDVVWALSTRMDPSRDTLLLDQTPIDYLDFASPVSGLGGKIGFDATHKWTAETSRQWGRQVVMSDDIIERIDAMWNELDL